MRYYYGALLSLLLVIAGFGSAEVVQLKEENWEQILQGEWMVEFYAPWCPACRALQASWEEFGTWSEDLNLKGIAQIDVTQSPGLSGRFMVTALPTIFHVKDGQFRQYRGARDKEAFISFIEEKKWSEIETISAWTDPRSAQMTTVAYFFKMSMLLRNLHTKITEGYGLPYWASYIFFAVATILLGALLGLILVCCIDCIYPPTKQSMSASVSQPKKASEEEEEDSDDEEDADEVPEDDKEKEKTTVRKRRAKRVE